jgi:uncharacterized 2Fe-2S/4Fe-4S cluster protein (DUF4445 family)
MDKIIFRIEGGEDVEIFAAAGENLLELARKANVAIDAPCSGNGSCGKCRVKLLHGSLLSADSIHIDAEEFREGWRLACGSTVNGDAVVFVPDIASAYRSRMKVSDLSSPEELAVFNALRKDLEEAGLKQDSRVTSLLLRLKEPSQSDTMPDNERLTRAISENTGRENVVLPYFVLKKLPGLLRENGFVVRCILEMGEDTVNVLDVLPGSDLSPACGLAVDVGTTSVSGLLVNLESGGILSKASSGNGQIRYGADVINRIVEQQKHGGTQRLQRAVIDETLLPLIEYMCADAGISRERIYKMFVASNTTMNHLLLAVNANPLRMEPYIPAFFQIDPIKTKDIGIRLSPEARLSLSPNIGSYVGGDITAGALDCMIWNASDLSMLIDLGTNGEIVLGNSEFLMACACSAGPAFEGGDISCGMRATDGAIDACRIVRETMEPEYSVIGGGKPVGLCGSGLIDVIAELFRTGVISGKGQFLREGKRVIEDEYGIGSYVLAFPVESDSGRAISLTEVDIDNFIRAKGAIYSAIMTLLGSLGFSIQDIEKISVAGGIGSGINIKNAIRIGMFPDIPVNRYSYIGNSSLAGAYAALISKPASDKLREIARSITYLELSTQPGYMDSFTAACFLPHTDIKLFPSAEVD